jgi:hypothetical protein
MLVDLLYHVAVPISTFVVDEVLQGNAFEDMV